MFLLTNYIGCMNSKSFFFSGDIGLIYMSQCLSLGRMLTPQKSLQNLLGSLCQVLRIATHIISPHIAAKLIWICGLSVLQTTY